MTDAQAATPGSSTNSKIPAVKDKRCQYCHQAFTSSSLGRHLDLYIKEKNAKPPDDLHNVEEIRRLRGNVTRRQARTSSGRRESSTPSNPKSTPFRDQSSPSIQGVILNNHPQPQQSDGGAIRTYLNKVNWQATGVINDLPSILDHATNHRTHSPPRRMPVKEEIAHKQTLIEERDRAHAAELALKEVLENVKAAKYYFSPFLPQYLLSIVLAAHEPILLHPSTSIFSASHSLSYACNAYQHRNRYCRVPRYQIRIHGPLTCLR